MGTTFGPCGPCPSGHGSWWLHWFWSCSLCHPPKGTKLQWQSGSPIVLLTPVLQAPHCPEIVVAIQEDRWVWPWLWPCPNNLWSFQLLLWSDLRVLCGCNLVKATGAEFQGSFWWSHQSGTPMIFFQSAHSLQRSLCWRFPLLAVGSSLSFASDFVAGVDSLLEALLFQWQQPGILTFLMFHIDSQRGGHTEVGGNLHHSTKSSKCDCPNFKGLLLVLPDLWLWGMCGGGCGWWWCCGMLVSPNELMSVMSLLLPLLLLLAACPSKHMWFYPIPNGGWLGPKCNTCNAKPVQECSLRRNPVMCCVMPSRACNTHVHNIFWNAVTWLAISTLALQCGLIPQKFMSFGFLPCLNWRGRLLIERSSKFLALTSKFATSRLRWNPSPCKWIT